jgi:hypothetical protein
MADRWTRGCSVLIFHLVQTSELEVSNVMIEGRGLMAKNAQNEELTVPYPEASIIATDRLHALGGCYY